MSQVPPLSNRFLTHENLSLTAPQATTLDEVFAMELPTPMIQRPQRPEGYIAREAIYGILDDLTGVGREIAGISLAEIAELLFLRAGVTEKQSTISAYKSQYKRAKGADKTKPTCQPGDVYSLIRLSHEIEGALKEVLREWHVDLDDFKSVARAVLDNLQHEEQ